MRSIDRRLSLLLLGVALLGSTALRAPDRHGETRPARRVFADDGMLSPDDIGHFEEYLGMIYDESGVDVRLVYARQVPDGDLEAFGLKRLRSLGVGRTVDRRGLLLVYDLAGRRLRVEVGPMLEGIITDGFAGYLMREHAAAFFAFDDPVVGLRTTLFMVHRRIREAALGQRLDPRVLTYITDSVRLAAGAGATARITPAGSSISPFLGRVSTSAERARFAPQPSPAATFARYLTWLRDGEFQTDLPLFTRQSQVLLKRLPLTRVYNDYILYGEYGQRFTIDVRGDRALLVFTTTPFVSPHFFRRTPQGWQMDIVAEVVNTVEYGGGAHTWGLSPRGGDFMRAYGDRIVELDGVRRMSGGDNRALPTRVQR